MKLRLGFTSGRALLRVTHMVVLKSHQLNEKTTLLSQITAFEITQIYRNITSYFKVKTAHGSHYGIKVTFEI